MANVGRFANEEVVFFPSKKLPSQKAELFQVKAGLYSNGAFNQLPQSFATQAPTATAAPVVPGRLRRDDKGCFFFPGQVHGWIRFIQFILMFFLLELRSLRTAFHHQWKYSSGEGLWKRITSSEMGQHLVHDVD